MNRKNMLSGNQARGKGTVPRLALDSSGKFTIDGEPIELLPPGHLSEDEQKELFQGILSVYPEAVQKEMELWVEESIKKGAKKQDLIFCLYHFAAKPSLLEPLFSKDDFGEIMQCLQKMKCDPRRMEEFFGILNTELHNTKEIVPNYLNPILREAVFENDVTFKRRTGQGDEAEIETQKKLCPVTRDDAKAILRHVKRHIACLEGLHLYGDDIHDFSLSPVRRKYWGPSELHEVAIEATEKTKTLYHMLVNLETLLNRGVELSTFTKRGNTRKEYGTEFAHNVVAHFYRSFKKLPSSSTKNGPFEKILRVCYKILGFPAPQDLRRTIKGAVEEFSKRTLFNL